MSIQIFILSKLMEENNYPYKLKKQISEPLPLDQIGRITESKLYYHFESLTKQGLVRVVKKIEEERRPDKQVYEITEKGCTELPKKIYKLFENAKTIKDMVLGIASLKYVNRDKVVEILEDKLAMLQEIQNTFIKYKNLSITNQEKENYTKFLEDYFKESLNMNRYWLEELINRIKQGDI